MILGAVKGAAGDQVQLSRAERLVLSRAVTLARRLHAAVLEHGGQEAVRDRLLAELVLGAEAAEVLAEGGVYVIEPVRAGGAA